jgi:hypothetical protein
VPDIRNIHYLNKFESDTFGHDQRLHVDTSMMLSMLAISSKIHDVQRAPFNTHITRLGHEGGVNRAKEAIAKTNRYPIFPDFIEAGTIFPNDSWIGAERLNPLELAGCVIVQKGVSLIDSQGKLIIDNGILVEAITVPSEKSDLADYYRAGISVAEAMAQEDEVVFSIEAAENPEARPIE